MKYINVLRSTECLSVKMFSIKVNRQIFWVILIEFYICLQLIHIKSNYEGYITSQRTNLKNVLPILLCTIPAIALTIEHKGFLLTIFNNVCYLHKIFDCETHYFPLFFSLLFSSHS